MLTYDLDRRGKLARYDYLYRCIREDILAGRLTAGEKLPSKRSLASHLQTAVITVQNAYAQLEAEGYLYTREKRGYYVADVERHPAAPGRAPARSAPQPQRSWLLDLSSGGSGTEDFPFSVWAKLMRRVLSEEGEALLRATPPNGADALRMMLIIGSTAGNDMRYSDEKVLACRNFANKLWNASRFVQMNLPEDFEPGLPEESLLDMSDKWILSELAKVAAEATANLDKYELGLAAEKVENFIWEVYCDWYIEICKTRLNGEDAAAADAARKVLVYVLDKALKLLHPFMPFITEEIYQALPGSAETIMNEKWPGDENMKVWAEDCADFEKLMDYIKAVRAMRAEMNVHPAKKTSMVIETASPAAFEKGGAYLARFAFATDVTVTAKYEGSTDGMVNVATPDAKGFIPMMELIDRDKELARLNKELTKAEKELGMFTNQLNNPKFVEKAPAKLVEETRAKLAAAQDKAAKIKGSIAALG